MGKSCSKICHFHHRSTSSTTFVVQPVTEQCTGKRLAVVPEIALVTTNVTEENQEDAVVIEMQESERRRDDVYSALHSAIKSCDFSSFQSLFEKADTVLSPEDAFSLLISACASNQTDISRLTLTRVRDVNVYTYPYENPLLLAIKHKNIETVLSLIEAGAILNPEFRNKEDEVVFSPVLAAVRAGDPDVLKLVVESGGDLAATLVRNRQGPTGTTVLDVVNPRHEDVKEYLAGAYPLARFQVRVTQKNCLTLTPEQVDEELTQFSLPGDFKLNCHGLTPWLVVCLFGVAPAFRRYLQATPGLVNSCDTVFLTQFGMTGLMYAALKRHSQICRELLAAGASVGLKNKWGKTAAHFAAEAGDIDLLDLMNPSHDMLNLRTEVSATQFGETVTDFVSLFCVERASL